MNEDITLTMRMTMLGRMADAIPKQRVEEIMKKIMMTTTSHDFQDKEVCAGVGKDLSQDP